MSLRHHADRATDIKTALAAYESDHGPLPGLTTASRRETWVAQMISSLRRIEFIRLLNNQKIDPTRLDPHHSLFDPLKGAALLGRKGQIDEAVWLTFIATHFGKHVTDGWSLASNVMGSFGQGPVWTLATYVAQPAQFDAMLVNNGPDLKDMARSGRFSNHRQYQSKNPKIISKVFSSFHAWQFDHGGFSAKVQAIHKTHGQNPTDVFDQLYRSLKPVFGFGRLGNFDFLTMLAKLNLAPIEAGSTYLVGATGPLAGAKLLFHNNTAYPASAAALGGRVDQLDDYLGVGKQVLEDSLCNWQKSPDHYKYFKG